MKLLENQIYELEIDLLKPEIRQSAERISQLLSEDFYEFCSSGSIYYYAKGDKFDNNIGCYEIRDFSVTELSYDCVLATYKIAMFNDIDQSMKYSLRSSIWKNINGIWKMTFHQGTLTSHF